MKDPFRKDRLLWAGWGILLLGLVVLGLRAQRITAQVQDRDRGVEPARPAGASAGTSAADGAATLRESLLTASTLGDRDPFRAPARKPEVAQATPRIVSVKEPAPEAPPRLRSLLYDEISPSVQLSAGDAVSGWLREGDTFQNWSIVEIGPRSVTVSSGGRVLVLGEGS